MCRRAHRGGVRGDGTVVVRPVVDEEHGGVDATRQRSDRRPLGADVGDERIVHPMPRQGAAAVAVPRVRQVAQHHHLRAPAQGGESVRRAGNRIHVGGAGGEEVVEQTQDIVAVRRLAVAAAANVAVQRERRPVEIVAVTFEMPLERGHEREQHLVRVGDDQRPVGRQRHRFDLREDVGRHAHARAARACAGRSGATFASSQKAMRSRSLASR